jgi:pseudaminic acid synthase
MPTIADRKVGSGQPTYVIAEISANHLGDFDRAIELVKAAQRAGADAVKLQTYTADTMTINADQEWFRIKETIWEGRGLYELYEEAHTPWDWQPKLKEVADTEGIHLFSSPFDRTAVDFLESMDVPAYKVASFELVDLPLIRLMAETGKPLIISTGMGTLEEIDRAVRTAREAGNDQIALLRTNSAYPASPGEMDLRTIPHMAEMWGIPVGVSDHTLGVGVPVAAVTLGASLIEKHLTLARSEGGPDAAFSAEPDEFAQMVEAVRQVEEALGGVRYGPSERERDSLGLRRSLFIVENVKKGELFNDQNVRSIRPAMGLPPDLLEVVIGRRAARDLVKGTPLSWDVIGEPGHP